MMVEYRPWSKQILAESVAAHKLGNISTLDIELTAKCTGATCIYCDSRPDVCEYARDGELGYETLRNVILDAKEHGLKWVYTCGLGEPLEDDKFWKLIKLLKINNIGLSIFTNGVFITNKDTAKKLKDCGVNIILKMDTFNEAKFDVILGKSGVARRIYKACDYLLDAGYGFDGSYTDLAFSIVPTSYSIDGISDVIRFAEENGIFASIGELEQAGNVNNHSLYSKLGVSTEEVKQLKTIADDYAMGKYMRPICPCIMTGIHLDNKGNCIVDKQTGLNCKWFLLKDPETLTIGAIQQTDIYSLFQAVNAYRKECFFKNHESIIASCNVSYTFGGCGGNPKDIISLAESII